MKYDHQELKPVYIHEPNYHADDEISLVDIALIVIRRKLLLISVFTLIFALGTTVALLTPKEFTYSTTIDIGRQIIHGSIKHIEPPNTLLAKLEHGYIPQTLIEHMGNYPEDTKKYRFKIRIPENSGSIILLEAEGSDVEATYLKDLLQTINQKAIQDHDRIFLSIKGDLESRLKQASNSLDALQNSKNNETEVASYQNIIESLSSQLANLQNTRVAIPPIKSLEPTSTSRAFIIILSAITGLILGIFSVFIAEFITKIKEKQREADVIPEDTN